MNFYSYYSYKIPFRSVPGFRHAHKFWFRDVKFAGKSHLEGNVILYDEL